MSEMKISVDMENTIAATQHAFLQEYNRTHDTNYTMYDIDSWDWVEEEIDYDEFMSMVDDIWHYTPSKISPTEVGLPETISALHNLGDVDIVTNRVGCEESMEQWLGIIGIEQYDELISTEESKSKLDYDYYVDDKPALCDEVEHDSIFLIRRPYNHSRWFDRGVNSVGTIREVAIVLQELAHHG